MMAKKRMQKKYWWALTGFFVVFFTILGWSELRYYLHLGIGQVAIPFQPIPISRYIPSTEAERVCIQALPHVLSYAKKMGLETEGSYEQIFPDAQPLLWAVSASYPFDLKPYRWSYPILGDLGYRGFFNLSWAEKEAARLRELGFHVRVRPVYAWSTLGYFSEVLSPSMLSQGLGPMAETIFHELFHRWYYLSGEDAWNENLAQHFGQHATLEFLRHYEGENGPEYQKYVAYLYDQEKWQSFLQEESMKFNSSYGAFFLLPGDSIFWTIRAKARRLPFLRKGKGQEVWRHHLPNLADFTTARQYFQWSYFLKEDLRLLHQGDLMHQMIFWKEKNALPSKEVNVHLPTKQP
jgi:predicted aminopeptidase